MKTLRLLSTLSLFAIAAQSMMAIPLNYDIGNGSYVTSQTANNNSGLAISTSLVSWLPSVAFTLNDGQSATFAFFNIWTTENEVDGSDPQRKWINAYLHFAIPSPNSGTTVPGQTYGITGFHQYGVLVWDGPVTVTAADRTFLLTLSGETFNSGLLWGLGNHGATVEATVTQLSSSTSVPEGSLTLSLLGMGMLMIAGFRRFLS